jgi:hypothetical protein
MGMFCRLPQNFFARKTPAFIGVFHRLPFLPRFSVWQFCHWHEPC